MTNHMAKKAGLHQQSVDSGRQVGTAGEFIESMFAAFEKSGIDYCVLRNYESLPDDHGNDVDILVAPSSLNEAVELVRWLAGKQGWSLLAKVGRYGYNALYFLRPGKCDRHLLIDLYTDCHWRGLSYVSSSYVLNSRVRYRNFWVASPGCEAGILVLKELLPCGKVKSKNNARDRIRVCVAKGKEDFTGCLKNPLGKKLAKWLLEQAENAEWGKIENHAAYLRWTITKRSFLQTPLSQITVLASFLLGHFIHRIRRPLGFFVVVLGPDGSGKSTISEALAKGLGKDLFSGVKCYHTNIGILPELKIFKRLFINKTSERLTNHKSTVEPGMVKPHSLIRSLVYVLWYSLDYLLGWFPVRYGTGKDRLVVFDRYFYDYFYQRQNRKLPHWFLYFLSKIVPRPDLIIYLKADPTVIYARKPELSAKEIKLQCEIISQLSLRLPNSVLLQTNRPLKEIVEEIESRILKELSQRHGSAIK